MKTNGSIIKQLFNTPLNTIRDSSGDSFLHQNIHSPLDNADTWSSALYSHELD